MGMTKTRQVGTAELLTPAQQRLQNAGIRSATSALGQIDSNLENNPLYQRAAGALQGILQPQSRGELEQAYKQTIADPTFREFNRNILPAIQQQFSDVGAGRSSALNQALAQASTDLSTNLASMRQGFLNNQQQLQTGAAQSAGQLSALPLQNIMGLYQGGLQRSMDPIIQQGGPNALSRVLGGAVQLGTAALGGI